MKTLNKRVLFIGEAITFAHVVRPLVLANTLDTNVFDIHVAFSSSFDNALKQNGILDRQGNFQNSHIQREHIQSRTPEEFERILVQGKELYDRDTLLQYVESDCELLNKIRPEVVIGDMRLSLSISAALLKIPYVCVTNAYWSPNALMRELPIPSYKIVRTLGINKLTRGKVTTKIAQSLFGLTIPFIFRYQAAGLNEARKHFGLKPFSNYLEGFTNGDSTLYADTPIVAPVSSLSKHERYIGPVCWSPTTTLPEWWDNLDDNKPIVYISLGSSGEAAILNDTIDGVLSLGAQVLISTGGRALPVKRSNDIYSADFIPGEIAAKKAHVVISNGGSPTSYQSLSVGTPVIGIASNMDQLVCMTNLALCDAGILVRADNLSAKSVKDSVSQILTSSHYKRGAMNVCDEFKKYTVSSLFPKTLAEITPSVLYPTKKVLP